MQNIENLGLLEKPVNIENLTSQVLKVLAGKGTNPATIKFISQLQLGNTFNAVFEKNLPGGKGVLNLEGNKVVVELPKESLQKKNILNVRQNEQKDYAKVSFKKGQTMTVRVDNTGSKPSLKITPQPATVEPAKTSETTTNLTSRGKTISKFSSSEDIVQSSSGTNPGKTARVIGVVDSKSILIQAGGKNYIAPVENAEIFKPGSQVNIQIEKTVDGQKLTLSNLSSNPAEKIDLNIIKPYLPARMPIGKMASLINKEVLGSPILPGLKINPDTLTKLRNTLNLFLPREGDIPTESQLQKQVNSSGINYEAKVRQVLESPSGPLTRNELSSDLKGLLLELQQSTEKASVLQKTPSSLTEFSRTIKYAIDSIELNQLSSQISKQENQAQVIQIPNPLSSGNKTIQLFVRDDSSDEEAEGKNKKTNHNVAFFLDLSFLGKLKINAQMGQDSLSVSIDVENEEIADFIRQRSGEFEETMNENKIKTSVECYVPHEVKPVKDNLIELLVNQKTSLVNIKT